MRTRPSVFLISRYVVAYDVQPGHKGSRYTVRAGNQWKCERKQAFVIVNFEELLLLIIKKTNG